MTDKLKPCPFCGGEAEMHDTEEFGTTSVREGEDWQYFVLCKVCGAQSPNHENYEHNATERWNTRAQPEAVTNAGDDEIETMQREFIDVLRAYKEYKHLWAVIPAHFGIFDVFYKTGGGRAWCIRVAASNEEHAVSLVIGVPGGRDRKLEKCVNVLATAEADLAKAREVMEALESGLKLCAAVLSGQEMNKNALIRALERSASALQSARTWLAANPKMGG